MLFQLAIDPILNYIEKKGFKCIAYADDILIFMENEEDLKTKMKDIKNEFSKYGLSINDDKSKIMDNKENFTYLGVPI